MNTGSEKNQSPSNNYWTAFYLPKTQYLKDRRLELKNNRVIKGKTPAFADVHPYWLGGLDPRLSDGASRTKI